MRHNDRRTIVAMMIVAAAGLLLALVAVAGAQSLGGSPDEGRVTATLAGSGVSGSGIAESDGHLDTSAGGVELSMRLLRNKTSELRVGAGLRMRRIDSDGVLLSSGEVVPHRLWDLSLSTSGRHRFASKKTAILTASIGTKTDEPFSGVGELALDVTAAMTLPRSKKSTWLFLVNYSNRREFLNNIPIPGLAFLYHPSRELQLTLGLPFAALRYAPTERTSLELSYFPVTQLHAKATLKLRDAWSVYSSFDWNEENYLRNDRENSKDRLFYYETTAAIGSTVVLGGGTTLDARVGYAFARRLFEGRDFFDRNDDPIELDPGAYGSVSVSWTLP